MSVSVWVSLGFGECSQSDTGERQSDGSQAPVEGGQFLDGEFQHECLRIGLVVLVLGEYHLPIVSPLDHVKRIIR